MKKKLTIIMILIATFCIQSNAQIVYTDIADTTIGASKTLDVDINNDGINDFEFTTGKPPSSCKSCNGGTNLPSFSLSITPLHSDQVLNTASYPKVINANEPINASSSTWNILGNQLMYEWYKSCIGPSTCSTHSQGTWGNQLDKYIGVKLLKNGIYYYGWIRVSVTSTSFTIKDYAFNAVSNQSINSGQATPEYIVTGAVLNSPFCAGSSVNVPYTVYGNFNPANVVTVELSDAAGSFANPVAIGNATSNVSGSINALIPAGTLTGSFYRIRTTTTNPLRISSPNDSNIIINSGVAIASISASVSTANCGTYIYIYAATGIGNTYQWKLNGNNISNATSSAYSAAETGNYSCRVTNSCGSATSNIVSLTFNAVAAVITSGTTTSCATNISLSAPIGAANTYQWKKNNNNISGATSANYSAPVSGDYSCQITNTCGSNISNIIHINVLPLPPAVISVSGSNKLCPGDTIAITANADSSFTYQWRKSSANIAGAVSSIYYSNVIGSYSVEVTSAAGCTKISNKKQIITALPAAGIGYSGPLSFCAGDSVKFFISGAGYLYQWKKNGVNITGATSYIYYAKTAGVYKCKLTNSCGSSTTPSMTVTVPCKNASSISMTNTESEHLSVFPNPATNSITIKFPSGEEGTIQIANLFGQIVFSEKIFSEETKIDVSKFSEGMYVVRWSSGENNETKTFSVVK